MSGTIIQQSGAAEVPQSPVPEQVYSSPWCCVCAVGSPVGCRVGVGIKLSCCGWAAQVQPDKRVARGWCAYRGDEILYLRC